MSSKIKLRTAHTHMSSKRGETQSNRQKSMLSSARRFFLIDLQDEWPVFKSSSRCCPRTIADVKPACCSLIRNCILRSGNPLAARRESVTSSTRRCRLERKEPWLSFEWLRVRGALPCFDSVSRRINCRTQLLYASPLFACSSLLWRPLVSLKLTASHSSWRFYRVTWPIVRLRLHLCVTRTVIEFLVLGEFYCWNNGSDVIWLTDRYCSAHILVPKRLIMRFFTSVVFWKIVK